MAQTAIPAITPGTENAERFAARCHEGWSDVKIGAEFDFSIPTVRKYREMLAPGTGPKKKGAAPTGNPTTHDNGDDATETTDPSVAQLSPPDAAGKRHAA